MTESEAGFTPEAGAADPAGPRPLRLTARDAEDLAVLSSMLQDAICSPSDIGFAPRDGLFALAVNRFCWEAAPVRAAAPEEEEEAGTEDAADLGPVYHRTQCGVRFHGVRRVSTRGFRLTDRGRLLSLLAVTVEAGAGAGHGGEGGAEGGRRHDHPDLRRRAAPAAGGGRDPRLAGGFRHALADDPPAATRN